VATKEAKKSTFLKWLNIPLVLFQTQASFSDQ
jgi:hypothetical protein